MKKICVFCGSSTGSGNRYMSMATELGSALAKQGYDLVYGGASVGCMGAIANSVLAAGGKVTGVIPQAISDMEAAHTGLTSLEVVSDMHIRKARMMELSDGFIALPGGLGTLEEIFEALTWQQLGFHSKPCALLNSDGYYQKLDEFLQHASAQGFVKNAHRENLLISDSVEGVLNKLKNWQAVVVPKL